MARFTRGLFVGGVYDRRTTLDTMLTKVTARDNKDYRFGIGGRQVDGLAGFGHSGFWNTFSYYFPELDLAVADNVYPLPDHVSLEVASMLDVYACGVHAINRIPLRAIDHV